MIGSSYKRMNMTPAYQAAMRDQLLLGKTAIPQTGGITRAYGNQDASGMLRAKTADREIRRDEFNSMMGKKTMSMKKKNLRASGKDNRRAMMINTANIGLGLADSYSEKKQANSSADLMKRFAQELRKNN